MYPGHTYENIPYFCLVDYKRSGFWMSFDADFRTEKEAVKFVYVLNEIATGGRGGSVTLMRGTKQLFIDYENIDWMAQYFKLPVQRYRPQNVFYNSEDIKRKASSLFRILANES